MKHFITFLPILMGFYFACSCSNTLMANVLAQPVPGVSSSAYPFQMDNSTVLEQQGKGGFFQKILAKRWAKKMKRAATALTEDGDGSMVAILSYLFFVGFIVALVIHLQGERTSLGAFHLSQVLGIFILSIIFTMMSYFLVLLPIVGLVILLLFALLLIINWLCGLIYAIKGKEKHVPLLGKFFEKSFRGLLE